MLEVAMGVPEVSDSLRKELEIWDLNWFQPSDIEPTEQETKIKAESLLKEKAEWLKRAKKKKWNDEMEKELIEEYKKKLMERVKMSVMEQSSQLAADGEFLRVEQLMIPSLKWNQFRRRRPGPEYWNQWMRKKSVVDVDVEGRRVTIRVHLKLVPGSENLKLEFEQTIVREKQEEEER